MKYTLLIILLLAFVNPSFSQAKKRGKVKRKYRNNAQATPRLQPVFIRGEIYDWNEVPLPGANVTVDGTKKGVHTNADGEFLIENLVSGKARLRISFIGFETKTIDYILRPGENYVKVMLREGKVHLPPVTVNAQKREQQLLDVPRAISALSSTVLEQSNITQLGPMSEFIPGLYIREQGANRPSFVIRGLSSDEVSPSAQPRISVYMNNVPVNRASGASIELFDMERIEVLRGPQNATFGRGAMAGAVHFISKKPDHNLSAYGTIGTGSFNRLEAKGAINVPIIEDKLFIRAAGIYNKQDGYVENTFGGTLNGQHTKNGRVSVRFLPAYNHKLDLVVNYQKDDTPGIAFMSNIYPNTNGVTDIFSGTASLEQGENLFTRMFYYDATLNYKYFINEHKYWSSISSYRNNISSARWDGDGTAAAAIDMYELSPAEQFYQEIRLNFARNSRLNGSIGASYWLENADQTYWFFTNEQHMAHLLLSPMPTLVDPNGQPFPMTSIPADPNLGPLGGLSLSDKHSETNFSQAKNQAAEIFIDGTYQLSKKFFFSAGVRGTYDMYKLSGENQFFGGSASNLGELTKNTPNLLFKVGQWNEISKNTLSFTGHAGLQYKFNEYGNIFAGYSRGRRPNVLQFTSTGDEEILDAEILNSFDGGFKASFLERVYIDVSGFYQLYKNFQTSAWVADQQTHDFDYLVKDGGKATSYGAEANLKIAVLEELDIFGNYAYLHSAFDSTDVDGAIQEYSGNRFRLSPEHSFTAGLNARLNITPEILFFVSPSYSYKTHMFFEDANTTGLEQDAYGLLNINGGLEFREYNIILSVYGTNLLDEQYITSAGNTGSLFGAPTYVPGPPRMIGANLTWKFDPGNKKTLRRSPSGLFKRKMY